MTTMIDRVILIAAGRGKRLGPHTEEIPKCMVQVGARPILGWVWHALSAVGVRELVVIRGYRGDVLETFVRSLVPGAIFVENPEWQTNNVLLSMACARRYFDRPTYVTYSDIIFTPAVAGPNPARRFSTNNAGDLTVTGTALGLTGEGHLIVTVQRWNDPPIR